MTVNQAARLASATLTVVCMTAFVLTGSLVMGILVLAAPLPMQLARISDRATWSVTEALFGRRDEPDLAAALDASLRAPVPVPQPEDDAFFLPGVPMPDASNDGATLRPPAPTPAGPPVSTTL